MRLDECLSSFTLPFEFIQCTDLVYTNNDHVECVQILYDNIISAMMDALRNIRTTNQHKKNIKFLDGTKKFNIRKKFLYFEEAFGQRTTLLGKVLC